MSRIAKYKKTKKQTQVKILVGVLFLTASIGGGIGVAFADSDINGLLSNWFNKKGTESISSIEQAIMTEKEIQKERLKQELQIEIQNSQKQLSDFTEQEKSQRIQAIREYADQLIANLKIDNSGQEQQIQQQLAAIVEKAKSEIDQVGSNTPAANDSNKNEQTDSNTNEGNNPQQDSPNSDTNNPQQDSSSNDNTSGQEQNPSTNDETNGQQPDKSPSDKMKNQQSNHSSANEEASDVNGSTDNAAKDAPQPEPAAMAPNNGILPIQ